MQTVDIGAARAVLELWSQDEASRQSAEMWVRWERLEQSAAGPQRAAAINWRAVRRLEDTDDYHALRVAYDSGKA